MIYLVMSIVMMVGFSFMLAYMYPVQAFSVITPVALLAVMAAYHIAPLLGRAYEIREDIETSTVILMIVIPAWRLVAFPFIYGMILDAVYRVVPRFPEVIPLISARAVAEALLVGPMIPLFVLGYHYVVSGIRHVRAEPAPEPTAQQAAVSMDIMDIMSRINVYVPPVLQYPNIPIVIDAETLQLQTTVD